MDLGTAAKRLGQTPERLESWEKGQSRPTVAQLRRAGEVYKRPLAVFYLPEVPLDFTPLRDLRKLPGEPAPELSSKLRFLIRRAREQEEWLLRILAELGVEGPGFVGSVSIRDDVKSAARSTRALLHLQSHVQRGWLLRDWIGVLEDAGVFVLQSSDVDVSEMRGFVLTNRVAPMILLNGKDAQSARVFTLFHEFAHILLGEESISSRSLDLPTARLTPELRVEVFCNGLAAEVLVPEEDLRAEFSALTTQTELDTRIESLARLHGVSREVIGRRLSDLGFITREVYETKRRQYQSEFEARKREEEEAEEEAERKYRRRYADVVVWNNGRAFTRLVLSAYGDGLITARDVSNLLNTKLKHLPRIERSVFALSWAQDVA